MKKIILFICLILLVVPFSACLTSSNQTLDKPNIEQPIPNQPEVDKQPEQEKKKKTYLVSKTDSLRVRSAPSSNGNVVGYLDKGDAVLYIDKVNDYYKTIYKESTAYVSMAHCEKLQIEYSFDVSERAIDVASTLLGYPYVWGSQRYHWGNGKLNSNFIKGQFDCSALTQYAYYHADKVLLEVTSRAQSTNGVMVQNNDLKRGDLMFFTNSTRKNKVGIERIGHVGIYFGNNYILHTASDHAVIEPISSLRWSYYLFSRRVV